MKINYRRLLTWLQYDSTNILLKKKELQSLLGKLNHVSQCVRPGRLFVSRLLNWLREISDVDTVSIPEDFMLGLLW